MAYEVANQIAPNGTTEAETAVTFVNGGGYGGYRKMTVAIEHSASSNSAFSVVAYFATEEGVVSAHRSTMWTGLTAPAAGRSDVMYYRKDNTKFPSTGTQDEITAIFSVPYFAFGLDVTGGQDVTYNLVVLLEID